VPMVGHPKWAWQMASASSPAALSMLEGLLNPMTQEVLPPECGIGTLRAAVEVRPWGAVGCRAGV
jgi:hypothetical protein